MAPCDAFHFHYTLEQLGQETAITDIIYIQINIFKQNKQKNNIMEQNVQPKSWLVESILVTLFCCLPLGIAGIVYAAKVNSLWTQGQQEAAIEASRKAGKWTKIGFGIGLAVIILYVLFFVLLGAGASMM